MLINFQGYVHVSDSSANSQVGTASLAAEARSAGGRYGLTESLEDTPDIFVDTRRIRLRGGSGLWVLLCSKRPRFGREATLNP